MPHRTRSKARARVRRSKPSSRTRLGKAARAVSRVGRAVGRTAKRAYTARARRGAAVRARTRARRGRSASSKAGYYR